MMASESMCQALEIAHTRGINMPNIILPKAYDHEKQDLWEACGFENKEETKLLLDTVGKTLDSFTHPSMKIEFIENLDISNRQKIALSYFTCGLYASTHIDQTLKAVTAQAISKIEMLKKEILRLGGSLNPKEFGVKTPKRTRPSSRSKN